MATAAVTAAYLWGSSSQPGIDITSWLSGICVREDIRVKLSIRLKRDDEIIIYYSRDQLQGKPYLKYKLQPVYSCVNIP